MYIHLGNGFSADLRDIVGVFDIENTTIGKSTKRLLERAEREKKCVYASMEMPKSFIIVMKNGEESVYISQLSASTIKKRIAEKI